MGLGAKLSLARPVGSEHTLNQKSNTSAESKAIYCAGQVSPWSEIPNCIHSLGVRSRVSDGVVEVRKPQPRSAVHAGCKDIFAIRRGGHVAHLISWPVKRRTSWPFCTSHKRAVPSAPLERTYLPSGEKAAPNAKPA